MGELVKKNWKLGIAFAVGIGLAWASWQYLVVPQFPTLIVDTEAVVEHDPYGIGYLPVELTGKSPELGKEVKVCVVPASYKDYVHNAPENGLFCPGNGIVKYLQYISWGAISVGVCAVVGLVIVKKKRGKL